MLTRSICLKKWIHVKIILENLTQRKKSKHTPSGYSLFTNCSFDKTKNKLDCYRGEDCMGKFFRKLRDHGMKVVLENLEELLIAFAI